MTTKATKYAGIVKLGTNEHLIRVRATCPRTGRRKGVERARECTLTEARELQRQWRDELIQSMQREDAAPRQRLRDFVTSWLRGRIEEGELKPSSADKIAVVWDLHIATSKISHLYIDDVTAQDIRDWVDELRAKRYAPGKGAATKRKGERTWAYSKSTIRGYYRVLRTILVAAGAEAACGKVGKLRLAPIGDVVARAVTKRGNYLTRDELRAVLAHVERSSPEWYAAVLLDVFVGLRWGELSALRWSDVNETHAVIRVERGNYEGRVVNSTKTGDDDNPNAKLVPLLPEVAEVLRARRVQMVAAQHPGLAEGWIFPTARGKLHKGSPLRKVITSALAACEIERRVTPHGLRHTANNELRRVADGEVVRAIIGHTTEAMTHHYSHVGEDEKHAAVARVFSTIRSGAVGAERADAWADRGGSTAAPSGSGSKNPADVAGFAGGATQI